MIAINHTLVPFPFPIPVSPQLLSLTAIRIHSPYDTLLTRFEEERYTVPRFRFVGIGERGVADAVECGAEFTAGNVGHEVPDVEEDGVGNGAGE